MLAAKNNPARNSKIRSAMGIANIATAHGSRKMCILSAT
jgi:hypothetical protein